MIATIAPLAALMLSVGFVVAAHGMQSTLLPLVGNAADFSSSEIGAMSSVYFVGFVAGCILSPYAIMRAGHIRAFAAIVSLMSASAILHPIFVDPIFWSLIRMVSGFCLAGFYLIVESWLNEHATNENRGAVMSFYIVIMLATLVSGQMIVPQFDISGFLPFALASIIVSIAVIPVALTRAHQPAPITLVRFRPLAIYKQSPTAIVGIFIIGLSNAASWTLAPLYAINSGLTTEQAAYFGASLICGGAASQWTIGRISDRIDRRKVLLALAVAATACAFVTFTIDMGNFLLALITMFLFGSFTQPAFAVAYAHGFDHAEAGGAVEMSSGLLLATGLGSVLGPLPAAYLMQISGPNGLFIWCAGAQILFALFVIQRLSMRIPLGDDNKVDFEYASTAQWGAVITPDALDVDDPNVIAPEEFPAYEQDLFSDKETSEPAEEAEIETAKHEEAEAATEKSESTRAQI